MKDLV